MIRAYLDDSMESVVSVVVGGDVHGVDVLQDEADGVEVVDQQALSVVEEDVDALDDREWAVVVERFERYGVDASFQRDLRQFWSARSYSSLLI